MEVVENEPEAEPENEDPDHDEGWRTAQGEATARNAWGAGRRGRRQPRATPTERAHEMVRRFGTPEAPDSMDAVCAVCGETYGQHFGGGDETTCPRDHNRTPAPRTPDEERIRRFNRATGMGNNDICNICGRTYGAHAGWHCPE